MGMSLCEAKSALFRGLAHPVRVRVLELLDEGPKTVRQLLDAIAIEGSRLSQQLTVLRGTGLVATRRAGNTVEYSLSTPEVTELLHAARQVLTHVTLGQGQLLAELRLEHAS
ncbi:metalloregulator ArsR/SmtB family transcription factor [Kibdelosporangium philippinense]|uniref:Metalloregulator ArsR/SmtB family transcription factor n=1 Tax=Kibdelosporangium philippinense TaxID=211113 RepID=A0ABS8ZGQ3_9PSEU|nr:metalloregulator ArsR/SmtB family transcription factor [Kibdelosporangium philippinense]MCE7007005.1 metalloregulator ArsR/SmtB family transcription factor [Kibdelosporangium philippinense]